MAVVANADRLLQEVREAQEMVIDLSGHFKDGDERTEQSLSMKQSMLRMIETEQRLRRYNTALEEVRSDMQRQMHDDTDEICDWGELLRSKIDHGGAGAAGAAGAGASSSARNDGTKAYRKHDKYKDLLRANPLCESDNDSDDDVQIDRSKQDELDMTCPLCMDNYSAESAHLVPLRSKKCGHHYSRMGIDGIFRSGGTTIACPIPGCRVKAMTKRDLEEDRVRMAALKRLSKRRKR